MIRKMWSHVGLVFMVGVTAGGGQTASAAQDGPKWPKTEADQIRLALSAAPESIRPAITVYALRADGYHVARQGTNGVSCLVERSHPGSMEPICWDREGSETILPVVVAKAAWKLAGASDEEMARREAEGFASGKFRAPARSGVSYMLSDQNWVFNGEKVILYPPHVMFYAPYLTNADIGSDGKDPRAPWILNEGSPHAYMIVVTQHGAKH